MSPRARETKGEKKQMRLHQTKKALVHLQNGILCSCENKEILPFATAWMVLDITVLCEISQSEKDKSHMIPLICGI